jgi:hypothetical protein
MDGYIGIRRLLLDENVPKNKVEKFARNLFGRNEVSKNVSNLGVNFVIVNYGHHPQATNKNVSD